MNGPYVVTQAGSEVGSYGLSEALGRVVALGGGPDVSLHNRDECDLDDQGRWHDGLTDLEREALERAREMGAER